MINASPFLGHSTQSKFVVIKGRRCGYIQLASAEEIVNYSDLSPLLFLAAHEWMKALEKFGAKRVYFILLSEEVKHIHIHLYPRWEEQEAKGLDLFAQREQKNQPIWSQEINSLLDKWAEENNIFIIKNQ